MIVYFAEQFEVQPLVDLLTECGIRHRIDIVERVPPPTELFPIPLDYLAMPALRFRMPLDPPLRRRVKRLLREIEGKA